MWRAGVSLDDDGGEWSLSRRLVKKPTVQVGQALISLSKLEARRGTNGRKRRGVPRLRNSGGSGLPRSRPR